MLHSRVGKAQSMMCFFQFIVWRLQSLFLTLHHDGRREGRYDWQQDRKIENFKVRIAHKLKENQPCECKCQKRSDHGNIYRVVDNFSQVLYLCKIQASVQWTLFFQRFSCDNRSNNTGKFWLNFTVFFLSRSLGKHQSLRKRNGSNADKVTISTLS